MPNISSQNLEEVARQFNSFTKRADDNRKSYTSLLLTIYTPVSAGLLLFSTKPIFINQYEKVGFLVVATSSVFIVLCVLLERLGYFFIANTQGKKFEKHVNKTGTPLYEPVYGQRWQNALAKYLFLLQLYYYSLT
jgi:hypothetical protein